jgi:chemotaxis protein MotA
MDLATIIGVVGGLAVVVIAMVMEKGNPADMLKNPAALVLTIGGAIAASMTSYPLKTLLGLPTLIIKTVMTKKEHANGAIELLVKMADKARREGLLTLEEDARKVEDAFLRRGVMMVVDGLDPAQVRAILSTEVKHMEERHEEGIGFLNACGGFAPTMGIIGTVQGLITVLASLGGDPGALGEKIGAAFLATLWGILTANLIWLPLAGKLRYNSAEEVAYRHLLIEGIMSLQAGENPRVLRDKLSAFLPPKARPTDDAKKGGKE